MPTDQRVNMVDVLRILIANRRFVALCTVGAVAISVIVSLVLPQWYESRATILPPQSAASQLDFLGMMRYAGYQPGMIPAISSPSEVYAAILASVRVKRAVIDSLDLATVYKETRMEKLLGKLRKRTRISVTAEGIVVVRCEDKAPERARLLVDAYVNELDRFNRFSRVTTARAVRQFIETRIGQVVEELDKAESGLSAFKDSTGAVLISEQATASIEAAADIFALITELEVRREQVSQFATERSPEIIDIDRQIRALERKLGEMGYGRSVAGADEARVTAIFPRFNDAPELEISLARLMRDVEVKRAVFAVLSEQYEQARIQEMKDTPTLQVLDWGRVPTVRSRPRRKAIVIITAVSAFFLSSMLAVVRQRARKGEYAREREAISDIKKSLADDLHDVKRLFGRR